MFLRDETLKLFYSFYSFLESLDFTLTDIDTSGPCWRRPRKKIKRRRRSAVMPAVTADAVGFSPVPPAVTNARGWYG